MAAGGGIVFEADRSFEAAEAALLSTQTSAAAIADGSVYALQPAAVPWSDAMRACLRAVGVDIAGLPPVVHIAGTKARAPPPSPLPPPGPR